MKKHTFSIRETIRMAWDNVRTQTLRTTITAGIIAIGISALVGILTSVAALKASMTDSFKSFGANVVNIQGKVWKQKEGTEDWYLTPAIEYHEARRFKNMASGTVGHVAISSIVSRSAEVKSMYDHTDPNIVVVATDENYMDMSGFKINDGRAFTVDEINSQGNVAIIGVDLANKLFTGMNPSQILGQNISIQGLRYTVIGILESKGSMAGMSQDNIVFLPLSTARASFSSMSIYISVTPEGEIMTSDNEVFMDEIRAVMRNVRSLSPYMADDFEMRSSRAVLEEMESLMGQLKMAALVIGLITILASSIALMNIMLVSVTERTREIGTMKAVGATPRSIATQFLLESVIIGQVGGVVGVIFGILLGNVVSMSMDTDFVLPWGEMLLAFAVTFTVGIISGYYPARKAARLDPIESLRYE